MDSLNALLAGFQTVFQPTNLLYCFVGVFIGTLIGVLPGIGPSGTISILLPLTFKISPVTSIIMLSGIYYGAMYGGSTTSILVNVPGEAASVVTCLDGYQMARQGRAGPALGIAAFGSFIAGTVSVILLMLLTTPLAKVALSFGPPEYFAMIVLGMVILTYLSQKSLLKSIMMGVVGFLLSFIGVDMLTATARYTFGVPDLMSGLDIIPVVMGLFGVAEVFRGMAADEEPSILRTTFRNLFPSRKDWEQSWAPITRGSFLGFILGLIPSGSSSVLSSFVSYVMEKRISKHPDKFGKGAIEGLAGPESANNSAFAGGLLPLFSLGIPSNVVSALLFGALMIHGIQPGPFLIPEHPEIFWGLVASMYVGNAMLLIINLPLIGIWVQLLRVPQRILLPLILLFCIIGSYGISNSFFDVGIMLIFGILGYLMEKLGYEAAPLILAFVLGPVFEQALRQSLKISGGSFLIFVSHPISALLLAFAAFLLFKSIIKKKRLLDGVEIK